MRDRQTDRQTDRQRWVRAGGSVARIECVRVFGGEGGAGVRTWGGGGGVRVVEGVQCQLPQLFFTLGTAHHTHARLGQPSLSTREQDTYL